MKKEIKNLIERYFYTFHAKKYEDLDEIIEKYDYISFDIFDTLIKRNVKSPTDIFDIIEKNTNIKDFKLKRIQAEKLARKKSKYEEITINDIYKEMNLDKEIMNLEIKLEKDFCTKNIQIYKLYQKLTQEGKKIFFTSDMYLPKNVVEEILKVNGYTKYEKLYVSSEYQLTKRSGNLFEKLIEEQHIEKRKVLHIGDSVMSDYLVPKKKRINTILTKRDANHLMFQSKNKSLDYNILSSFINNNINSNNPYEHFGYEVLGPILYSFTTWIHEKVKEDKIDKLYFLARDAKIIMDVYKERFGEEIPIYYIHVSRKAVVKANLYDLKDYDDMIKKVKSLIFLDTSKVQDLLDALQLKQKISFKNKQISKLNEIEKEKLFKTIKYDIESVGWEQNQYLKDYLKDHDFNGNVGLVDIGWNGTIQFYLEKYKNNNTKLFGYYYGINKAKKFDEYGSINRNGYLFNNLKITDYQSVIRLSAGIFETMFLSTEPTTLGYKKIGELVSPLYGKKENSDIFSIKLIQNYAQQFIEDIKNNSVEKYIIKCSKETFFENYKNFAINPTRKNINLFKNLEYSNVGSSKLIQYKSLLFYIFHPKQFYIDLRSSNCHVIFMKAVFKIKLPYYKILKKLYESGAK